MKVNLVNMPGASIRPALGISLLKSILRADGHEVTVTNLNIDYARWIGVDFYHYLCEIAPPESLVTDWLFSCEVFPEGKTDDYPDELVARYPSQFPAAAVGRLREVQALSAEFLLHCADRLRGDQWDVIGFSTSFSQNMGSLALARLIKASHPATIVAFGGSNCEGTMGLALHRNFPVIDLVFSGEADVSLPAAIRSLAGDGPRTSEIPGVIARSSTGESAFVSLVPRRIPKLDDLPFPDYDDFFRDYTQLPVGSRLAGIPMETSRGCWWGEKSHCTFCGLNANSMAFASKSPARALAEIDHLHNVYHVRDIQMVDNILDMKYLQTLLPRLAERGSRFSIFYQTKGNLTGDHLSLMRAAGVRAIQVGVESLDTDVLRMMRKGMKGIQAIELLMNCREAGIWPHWNILFGFPEEPAAAYAEMAALVGALSHLDPPNVCVRLRLDRFSPLFCGAGTNGIQYVRPNHAYTKLYSLPDREVRDLAYYFDFEYADARVPEHYTRALCDQVQRWQEKQKRVDLTYRDIRDELRIVDTRFDDRSEILIRGAERELYLYCREPRTRASVAQRFEAGFAGSKPLEEPLERWVSQKLMVLLDNHYLSLALDWKAVASHPRKPSWSKVLERTLGSSANCPVSL